MGLSKRKKYVNHGEGYLRRNNYMDFEELKTFLSQLIPGLEINIPTDPFFEDRFEGIDQAFRTAVISRFEFQGLPGLNGIRCFDWMVRHRMNDMVAIIEAFPVYKKHTGEVAMNPIYKPIDKKTGNRAIDHNDHIAAMKKKHRFPVFE